MNPLEIIPAEYHLATLVLVSRLRSSELVYSIHEMISLCQDPRLRATRQVSGRISSVSGRILILRYASRVNIETMSTFFNFPLVSFTNESNTRHLTSLTTVNFVIALIFYSLGSIPHSLFRLVSSDSSLFSSSRSLSRLLSPAVARRRERVQRCVGGVFGRDLWKQSNTFPPNPPLLVLYALPPRQKPAQKSTAKTPKKSAVKNVRA